MHDISVEPASTPNALVVGERYRAGHEESVKTGIHNLGGLDKRFLWRLGILLPAVRSSGSSSAAEVSEAKNLDRISAGAEC